MLFADPVISDTMINGGSVTAVTVVLGYVVRLIPKFLSYHRETVEKFDQALARRDEAARRSNEQIVEELRAIGTELKQLNERVNRLESRTDEHRPLEGG